MKVCPNGHKIEYPAYERVQKDGMNLLIPITYLPVCPVCGRNLYEEERKAWFEKVGK